MAERECRGMTRLVSRILVGAMVVTSPGLHPYAAFAQARTVRAQPAVSGIRTTGYAPLSQNINGGITAGALTGAALKVNLLSPASGLTPKIQVMPALAAPEAVAQQAPIGGIAASGQLAAAALAAPQMEKQDSAALKSESAKAFDGMKVKPAAGNDEVQAGAMGANLAASGLVKSAGSGVCAVRNVPAPSRMQRAVAATKSYLIRNKTALLVSAGAMAAVAIGHALGFNGIGDMSWGLGGLPMAFMGMLGPQDDAFLDELKRSYDPGEILTQEIADEIGQRLGVADVTSSILDKLVEEGQLMRIVDGGYMYVDFNILGNPADAEVQASVREALQVAREGRLEDSVAAVAYLDDAVKKSTTDPYLTQAQALRDNASVMFLLNLMKENKRAAQKMAAEDPLARPTHEATQRKLDVVIARLEDMTFSAGMSVLPTISVWMRNALMSNMMSFVSQCHYGMNGRKALSPDADRGSDRVREF
ncbi:MAG: hypothetical protein WC881_09465, partial [Elusimicrobiota bacterium]